jgi:hypothetical protein
MSLKEQTPPLHPRGKLLERNPQIVEETLV